MILFIRSICLIIVTLINYNCANNPSNNTSHSSTDSIVTLHQNIKLDTVINISNCLKEKELIRKILTVMKARVNNVRKAYDAIRFDELEWGKYIRNWNIAAQDFRAAYNSTDFSCIHSFYMGETWIDLLEIGTSYAFDDKLGVKKSERKLNSDIVLTLKELKSIKSK